MKPEVRFHPRVESDLKAAMEWYESQQDGLGERLAVVVVTLLERIQDHPHLYGVFSRRTRGAPVAPFPYVLYYRPESDHIDVVAILHGAMNPRLLQRIVS